MAIGLTWQDIESAGGGEVAAAMIQPNPQDKMSHATALPKARTSR
jgi:hypothetical protein